MIDITTVATAGVGEASVAVLAVLGAFLAYKVAVWGVYSVLLFFQDRAMR